MTNSMGWAIQLPTGEFSGIFADTRDDAITSLVEAGPEYTGVAYPEKTSSSKVWKKHYRQGFRARRVKLVSV